MHQKALLKRSLVDKVEAAIRASRPEWEAFVDATLAPSVEGGPRDLPLAMKYIPVERARDFLPARVRRSFNFPGPFPPPDPPGQNDNSHQYQSR